MVFCEISSEELSVKISPRGAEIQELKRRGLDHNWIWPSLPPWPRSAPLLFPIVGRLKGDRYQWREQEYTLTQHGFARDCDFELLEKTSNQACFRLQSSTKTLNIYPFHFELEVEYRTENNKLQVSYQVRNRGGEPMPFNIGWHPAFVLPAQSTTAEVKIQGSSEFKPYQLLQEGLLSNEIHPSGAEGTVMFLHPQSFAKDALIFLESQQKFVRIEDASGNSLRVGCEAAPHLGLWTKDLSKFICIEPWWGYADTPAASGLLQEKPGIQILNPGEVWTGVLQVEVGE